MKQYQEGKSQYTARSIKAIFKYQSGYLPELLRHLTPALPQFTQEELGYLTEVLAAFPIKRRALRQAVVYAIKN